MAKRLLQLTHHSLLCSFCAKTPQFIAFNFGGKKLTSIFAFAEFVLFQRQNTDDCHKVNRKTRLLLTKS